MPSPSKEELIEEFKRYLDSQWRRPDGSIRDYTTRTVLNEETILEEFSHFIDSLMTVDQYDAVLLSIGCAPEENGEYLKQQQWPHFINKFKKPNKILILNIDIQFLTAHAFERLEERFLLKPIQNDKTHRFKGVQEKLELSLEAFGCHIPGEKCLFFAQFLEKQIQSVLDKGRQFFIANHTQSYSLEDIPQIAAVYNAVKQNHCRPQLLQLYTQGGHCKKVTYYLDLLYDDRSNKIFRDEWTRLLLTEDKSKPAFYVCNDMCSLVQLPEFKPTSASHAKKYSENHPLPTEEPSDLFFQAENNQKRDCTYYLKGLAMIAFIGIGLSFGLMIYTVNELIKAYQEDQDNCSYTKRASLIAPTILAASTAGYAALTHAALLTGLNLSTGGIALAVFIAVSITAASVVLLSKLLHDTLSDNKPITDKKAQEKIDANLITIKTKDYTLFYSSAHQKVRALRREITTYRNSEMTSPS